MLENDSAAIRDDEQATALLKQALEGTLAPDQSLELANWPRITVRLTGPIYDGTITAATARALIEVQAAVDNAYLRLLRPDGRRLTDEEKRKTAITARVEKGSSLLTLNLDAPLTQLVTELTSKMSPTDINVFILGFGLIAGATVVAKQYVKSRAERAVQDMKANVEIEGRKIAMAERVALSEQETKRAEIIMQARAREPVLERAAEDFDTARDELLRSARDANVIDLDGVRLSGAEARKLVRQQRTQAEEQQLNGVYHIAAVRWPTGEERAVLDLRATEQAREFAADLDTRSLLPADKDLLMKAEWDRAPIYLSINARVLRGRVTHATVVGFDWETLRERAAQGALDETRRKP